MTIICLVFFSLNSLWKRNLKDTLLSQKQLLNCYYEKGTEENSYESVKNIRSATKNDFV